MGEAVDLGQHQRLEQVHGGEPRQLISLVTDDGSLDLVVGNTFGAVIVIGGTVFEQVDEPLLYFCASLHDDDLFVLLVPVAVGVVLALDDGPELVGVHFDELDQVVYLLGVVAGERRA